MKEFVGVTHFGRISDSLKREALFFDRIGVYCFHELGLLNLFQGGFLQEKLKQPLENAIFQTKMAIFDELDWLIEQGIAFNLAPSEGSKIDSDRYEPLVEELDEKNEEAGKEMKRQLEEKLNNSEISPLALLPLAGIDIRPEMMEMEEEELVQFSSKMIAMVNPLVDMLEKTAANALDIGLRIRCTELQAVEGIDAFPLVCYERLGPQLATKADTVRIVLNALPVPNEQTPWEQIIDYRNDSNTKGKVFALRHWMTDVAKGKMSANEIQENLEWLLYDYQRHLELHKLKYNWGVFETVLTVGAEFMENIVKLNLGKAAKQLFTFKHRRIDLMEAEIKSPGSEVAYILSSREKFLS